MKIKELIKELKKYDENSDVILNCNHTKNWLKEFMGVVAISIILGLIKYTDGLMNFFWLIVFWVVIFNTMDWR